MVVNTDCGCVRVRTRASSNVSDFNCGNKVLIAKLLKQGYRYYKLRKVFFLSFIANTVS